MEISKSIHRATSFVTKKDHPFAGQLEVTRIEKKKKKKYRGLLSFSLSKHLRLENRLRSLAHPLPDLRGFEKPSPQRATRDWWFVKAGGITRTLTHSENVCQRIRSQMSKIVLCRKKDQQLDQRSSKICWSRKTRDWNVKIVPPEMWKNKQSLI